MINESIFKAYDIRGHYPDEIDEKTAYAIGRAIGTYLKAKNIAVGRDSRPSSEALWDGLSKGIMDTGSNVLNIGPTSTPVVYFASCEAGVDGSVTITASHNPREWNGFKLTAANAVPISGNSGLEDIKKLSSWNQFKVGMNRGITIMYPTIMTRYHERLEKFWRLNDKKFNVVIDCANAMGATELPVYKNMSNNITLTTLYDDIKDKAFMVHEANPLKTETLDELQKKVVEIHADIGIAYDGDADRIGFVDEMGAIVPMDLVTAILAAPVLKKYPGGTILYDLRSSMSVKETIEKNGGQAHECMVGHANIKTQMRKEDAYLGGELSGHYYFKENAYAEMSTLVAIFILNEMAATGKKLSELVAEVRKYFHSGEINNIVSDTKSVMEKLKEKYKDGTLSELDGIKVSYPDWWFNVRSSNTEPLLRLNLEAKTKEMMEEKKKEILAIIFNP
jgi:phosphomannomutase